MKKFIITIFIITIFTVLLLYSSSITIYAGEIEKSLISSGYNENGVYYEVYGDININQSIDTYSNTLSVERGVVYNGKIIPTRTILWSEVLNSKVYSGELVLARYIYDVSANKTYAYYKGDITSN